MSRTSAGLLTIASVILLAVSGPANAGQVVKFKTGFELTAESVRYEGQMIIVTLDGGSEIGFPRWVIEDVARNDASGPGKGDPTLWNQASRSIASMSSRQIARPGAPGKPLPAGMRPLTFAVDDPSRRGQAVTVGYSVGNDPVPISKAASGPVTSDGALGRSIKDVQSARRANTSRKPTLVQGPGVKQQ